MAITCALSGDKSFNNDAMILGNIYERYNITNTGPITREITMTSCTNKQCVSPPCGVILQDNFFVFVFVFQRVTTFWDKENFVSSVFQYYPDRMIRGMK